MDLHSLLKTLRVCLFLVFVVSVLTVTSVAEVLPRELLQGHQGGLSALFGSLLIALAVILLVSVLFIRFYSPRKKVRKQSAEQRELARLIEKSVNAGQSALE